MDNSFRMRLRKREGVTKKGPLVAKHPVSSSSITPTPNITTGHTKEIRSPVGLGPPLLGSHRRRPLSPDPRLGVRRPPQTSSNVESPKSSPKTSPIRHHRERSPSPTNNRRYPGTRGTFSVGSSSRTGARTPPSPIIKRYTPPTSPRVRRPTSPVRGASSPVVSKPSTESKGRSMPLKCFPNLHSMPKSPSPTSTISEKQPHPPSPTSSRPSSPGSRRPASPRGSSPRGRGASPGSKSPPISEEELKTRVEKAHKARLYLLHQPGPNSFSVGSDAPNQKYKVIIGPQSCSCGHGPYCVHVLFVMVRVLQLADSDSLLMAGSLKDYEVEQLLRVWENRRKKAIHARERRAYGHGEIKDKFLSRGLSRTGRSPPGSPTGSGPHSSESSSDTDAQCPICLMTMVPGENLASCEAGCRNFLHHHCMAVWAADRHAQGQPLLCPLCRAPWSSRAHPRSNPFREKRGTITSTAAPTSNKMYPVMSASFSGGGSSDRRSPSSTTQVMSRSLSSAYPHSNRATNAAESAYSSPCLGDLMVSAPLYGHGYPPTVRGEISAALVHSASDEMVPLPHSEPIPEEHEATACTWVAVFGNELIACLFSRDWAVRETGLRRLSHEVIKFLRWDYLVTTEKMQKKVVHCCANILAQVANDPVYKVYIASLRCVRVLLSHLCPNEEAEVTVLQNLFRPLLHTLLLKCADGNRRTSQISIDFLIELSRGQSGELALATQSGDILGTTGLGAISYVLSCILDDSPPTEAPWQWLLGRLCVLDRLLDEFPQQFQLQVVEIAPAESGYKLQHYDRLMTVVEFAFKALGSNHATVSKLARRIYICGARMAAVEPAVFNQVCGMLAKLDVSLQMRLKRRLRSMQTPHGERRGSFARLGDKLPLYSKDSLAPGGSRLIRSVSHSPSRMLSALRSSSQSPARPGLFSKTPNSKKEYEDARPTCATYQKPSGSPPRPTHLPLKSFDVQFKEKQSKLRLYHKARAKYELPLIVQQALIFPSPKGNNIDSAKNINTLLNGGGLSQSYGDNLDLTPQTPVAPICRPYYLLKEAIGTPATPTAPYSTPVKETPIETHFDLSYILEKEETPLPPIPGLDLIPKYLDEDAYPNEQTYEGSTYEEGKEWSKGPLLGTGAFSCCYQARDVMTGTIMAVKQLSVCRNSEEEQERVEAAIEEEILMMSKLRHKNIVRLLGATRVKTSFCLFSEWMAGGSVAGMLDKYGAFAETVIIKYTKQILSGLQYLHDSMILHRDLKGANLLVDSTGQLLRIGDFGTAARLANKSTITGEFQGQLLGTIAFMAPEVLRGDDYGRACDVWSVGCCIIEMATTKPPWGANSVTNQYKLMFRIATSDSPPHVPDNLSASTRDIALKCLQICSSLRPSTKKLLRHRIFNNQPP